MIRHDAFLSYAAEDKSIASEIVNILTTRGLRVWYAPIDLRVGEKLLDSVEKGMKESLHAILLISTHYLKKGWTNYEMDTLLRDHIERNRKLFPIWHLVQKEDVENRHSGLAGINALNTDLGIDKVCANLSSAMTDSAPTIGIIPSWESPKWRFLNGHGEIKLNSEEGQTTTLWEFLIYKRDSDYPLFIEGELFTKEDLLIRAANIIPHITEEVINRNVKDGKNIIIQMCKEIGFDPYKYV